MTTLPATAIAAEQASVPDAASQEILLTYQGSQFYEVHDSKGWHWTVVFNTNTCGRFVDVQGALAPSWHGFFDNCKTARVGVSWFEHIRPPGQPASYNLRIAVREAPGMRG